MNVMQGMLGVALKTRISHVANRNQVDLRLNIRAAYENEAIVNHLRHEHANDDIPVVDSTRNSNFVHHSM